MHPPEWRFFLGIRAGLFERLEQWTKATVGAVGILYVLGFLVHTLYLGSYGITVVNLLRTQYILAGAWLMMPPVLLCALGVFVFSVVEDRRDPKKGPDSRRRRRHPNVRGPDLRGDLAAVAGLRHAASGDRP